MSAKAGLEKFRDGFGEVVAADARPEPIADGLEFTEGPVWMPHEGCLIFSDIPGDTLYRWSEADGLDVFRHPSRHANGNTVDLEGRLLTCEHGSRRLTRTEEDGTVATLASTYEGGRLNSPNDVVVKSDGTIWFTDPPYGIEPKLSEQPANYVFRLDPGGDEPVAVTGEFSMPNGLCFSPDERLLYVADSDLDLHHIHVARVEPDNTLAERTIFADIAPGVPDGIRCDTEGRVYSTAEDGVQVFTPKGELLGKIHTPQTAANCAFGGPEFRTLFITATSQVWRIRLEATGCRPGE